MMKDSRLTIIMVSCDDYSDMWSDFFKLKEMNWADCPFETVLANNVKNYQNNSVRVINCGLDAVWSKRTRTALEQIESKYVCFMLEDYFISDKVDTFAICKALNLMDLKGIKYYKLLSFSKIKTPYYDAEDGVRIIPDNLRYGISLQPAIWDREYFLELIGEEDYNPWVFEVRRIEEAKTKEPPFTVLGLYNERNLLNICHMVVQGKYIPNALKKMEKKGYIVDTHKRDLLKGKKLLEHNLKNILEPIITAFPWVRKIGCFIGIESVELKNK